MNIRIIFCLVLAFISTSCSYVKDELIEVYSTQNNVELIEKCLLFEGQLDGLNAPHTFILYKENDSNSWRKEGWLPTGTKITISSMRRSIDPARKFYYFVGQIESQEGELRRFVYTTSAKSVSKAKAECPWKWD